MLEAAQLRKDLFRTSSNKVTIEVRIKTRDHRARAPGETGPPVIPYTAYTVRAILVTLSDTGPSENDSGPGGPLQSVQEVGGRRGKEVQTFLVSKDDVTITRMHLMRNRVSVHYDGYRWKVGSVRWHAGYYAITCGTDQDDVAV